MIVTILQILYLLLFFSMFLMSVFIVYHIVFYSYSMFSKLITLLIFVPVVGVLLFSNFVLFSQIPLQSMFVGMLTFGQL